MGLEAKPPVMSSLNPNAREFVPAARRVVVEESRAPVFVAPSAPVEDSSEEWLSRIETDEAFRVQCLSLLSPEQRNALVEDLDELADYAQFEGYQEHLVDLEEDEILARNLREMDVYLDEDLSLTGANANGVNGVETPKDQQQLQQRQQAPWSKNPSYYQNKTMPHKVGSYPKKWNTYRIHQPRSDV
ncbi:hypothetical protein M758_1G101900 [Ceratodon purpureus]|nr:hypothetical protein M758_1G101900 [Ceratodon purpureus]